MTFYEKVLIIYLLPGHSHMIADRVVAWAKKALAVQNLYSPTDILERINTVKGMKAKFIDHELASRASYTGWEKVLNKWIKNLRAGFTSNYVYEFSKGSVRMQHLVSTSTAECSNYALCTNPETAARELKQAIIGTQNIDNLNASELLLPRIPVKVLDNKKVISLQKKYSTNPDNKLAYFPDPVADLEAEDGEDAPAVANAAVVAVPAIEIAAATVTNKRSSPETRTKTKSCNAR